MGSLLSADPFLHHQVGKSDLGNVIKVVHLQGLGQFFLLGDCAQTFAIVMAKKLLFSTLFPLFK